jgi:hypothetical protein
VQKYSQYIQYSDNNDDTIPNPTHENISSLKNDENSQWVIGLTDYNKIIIHQNAVTILVNI